MRVALALAAAALLAACQPAAGSQPRIAIASVLACQNAVQARGFPGASFEQVDAQPGRNPPITGTVVSNGQRARFACTLDGAGQVSGVSVDGQPR